MRRAVEINAGAEGGVNSFDDREDTYVNTTIIPDKNTIIRIKESHDDFI
jgi:hypothetical protein